MSESFAVCIVTYQRKNGKSPFYLNRSVQSILNQTYDNWKLYVYGDKYEDEEEFNSILSIVPSEKLVKYNMDVALERENVKDRSQLWMIGGINTMNTVRQKAVDDGYKWICHLDDDDYWHPSRLQIINDSLQKVSDPCFIYNYSTHNGSMWPPVKVTEIRGNNLKPTPGYAIHSSFIFNKKLLNQFKMKTWPEDYKDSGDWQTLQFIDSFLKQNKDEYSLFIPQLLVYHPIEGESRT